MIFSEKSGQDPSSDSLCKRLGRKSSSNLMPKTGKAEAGVFTFSDVVDKACEGLAYQHIKFSIRRIQEMEERLCVLEQELDAFLKKKE